MSTSTNNRFRVKPGPTTFSRSIQPIKNKAFLQLLDTVLERLRENPYIGIQLRAPYEHLWEIYIGRRYRLYYEVWERKRVVLLKAVAPRNLQRRTLRELE